MSPDGSRPAARAAIREVVENWAIFRDSADWEGLADTWHPDGTMVTTWFREGGHREFIDASRRSWEAGGRSFHVVSGSHIDVAGHRALAQSRMSINVRAFVGTTEVDVTAFGRFVDFFECREEEWRIVHRRVVYEKDRLDPVAPGAAVTLDRELLARWPEGYRHLAYVQSLSGVEPVEDLPCLRGTALETLSAAAAAWVAGR